MQNKRTRRRWISVRHTRRQALRLLGTFRDIVASEPRSPDRRLLEAAVTFHDVQIKIADLYRGHTGLRGEAARTRAVVPLERQADQACLQAAGLRPATLLGHRARAAMAVLADETLLHVSLPSEQLLAALLTDLVHHPDS